MSLLWIDGFEGYGTTPGGTPSPSGVIGRRYVVNQESNMDVETGRISGYALQFTTTSCLCQTPALNTNATLIVGFAFKINEFDNNTLMQMMDGATLGMNLQLMSSGEIRVRRGVTDLDTTSGLGLSINTWYWLEFKVLVNSTTGSYELRIGGTNVLSDSGISTQAGSNAYYDIVQLKAAAAYPYFDDFYICNGAGSSNNDFLGDCHVTAIFPDGAGNSTDWTPSAGDNYACVDENPVTDDTDYVESSTSTDKDLYSYGSCGSPTNIKGLQINTDCRQTDATSYDIITPIRSGSTDYDDSAQTIGTTDYVTKRRIEEEDPDTSAAWTASGINSAEFGIKVN